MNEKELRAILALKGLSLMVVQAKIKYYRFCSPNLGKGYFDRASIKVESGWLVYTVPRKDKPVRDRHAEEDLVYLQKRLYRHRGDAIRKFVKTMLYNGDV
jgi:hypothetical protein